jgi:PAS domain S-box-containing protein
MLVATLTISIGFVLTRHGAAFEACLSAILAVQVAAVVLVAPMVLLAGRRYHRASSAELKANEERFRSTFEQAAVGIAHVAPRGEFLRINARFCEIVGYTRGEMLERTFQDITHPDDLDADLEQVQRLLRGEADTYSMTKRYYRKDGQIVWVVLTVSLLRDDGGHPRWFVSVVEDAAWERALGYTEEELLAKPFVEFVHPDDRASTSLEAASLAAGKSTFDFENRYLCQDGSIRHISWVVTPLPDEQMMYCIARDITARKQAEAKIQEYQQRLRSLASQLTVAEDRERRTIAADLHDHVGGALALARLQLANVHRKLSDQDHSAALVEEASQTIQQAIRDTRNLIFDLSSPMLDELGLGAAIEEWTRHQIEDRHGLRVEVLDEALGTEPGDDLQAILFRSVRELLTNVVKHAGATSAVVRLAEEDGRIMVTVEDNGVGFDPASLPSRDQTFGLFSIQERMENLGGELEIDSQPGAGCTASLRVPFQLS